MSIVVTSGTYNQTAPKTYVLSTNVFGSPQNEYRLNVPLKASKSDNAYRLSVTRVIEKELDDLSKFAIVTISVTAPEDFSSTELASLIQDGSEFMTQPNIDKMLQGVSTF